MKKNVKAEVANEVKNPQASLNKVEKIMKEANVTVGKQVKAERKTFKDIILNKIDMKAKTLPDYVYDSIRERIGDLLNELEDVLDAEKNKQRLAKTTFKRLAQFSKEDIAKYLETLNGEVK